MAHRRKDRTPGWMWLLSGVGAYALLAKVLQVVANFSRRVSTPEASHVPEPGSPAFLEALSGMMDTPIRRGGSIELLGNGDAFFPALLEAIRGAEHSIHLMTYIWKRSPIGDRVFEALMERLEAGVEVRICVDGIGSFLAPSDQFDALAAAGAQVEVYHPILSPHFVHVNRRNHRRAYVVDGRIGFTGGISIAAEWSGDAENPAHWRDTMIRVTGPPAHSVQAIFAQIWTNMTGEHLVGPKYYPPFEPPPGGDLAVIGASHTPSGQMQPLWHFFWLSLRAARRRIYLASAYPAPSRHFRTLLMEKARQGIDVRLLVPGPHTDNVLVRWNAQHFYEAFLEAGIRIFEYTPTMMHAKMFTMDGCWSFVGSADLGPRSFKLNQESVLGIAGRAFARRLEEMFEADFARATEVTLDAWRRRPWYFLVRERAAAVLAAQY